MSDRGGRSLTYQERYGGRPWPNKLDVFVEREATLSEDLTTIEDRSVRRVLIERRDGVPDLEFTTAEEIDELAGVLQEIWEHLQAERWLA